MLIFWKEEKEIKKIFMIDFLLCSAGFLLVPIIPIYMKEILKYNISQIGFIIGIPSIICCILGGISYFFYKKFGIYYSVVISLLLDIAVYSILLLQTNFKITLFFYILKGISTCIFMPILKNLYVIILKNKNNKNLVFKYQYILICLSAIASPFLSKIIYPISYNYIFYIVLILYFISLILLIKYRNYIKALDIKREKINIIKVLISKKIFFIFLLACIGILTVFSQFEGTFILTLNSDDSLDTFTKLLILNSIFGIIIQAFNLKFFKNLSAYSSLIIGCISFGIAYLSFLVTHTNIYLLILSILLFTFGETFIMPNIEVFITEISVDEDRVLLYGISEFKRLGFFLGPFVSGYFIQYFSSKIMFLVFAGISIFSCLLFIIFKKLD